MLAMLNKQIILGVTGGIAAYKAVDIVRLLRKQGMTVHVIMSKAATSFVTPLTFREISGQPVTVSMWDAVTNFNVEHIALANLADAVLVAPATANIIGKVAGGIADDMMTTTIMATKAPVFFAPAMNSGMYENPIVQENIARLLDHGYNIIPPESGMLACGVNGVGRLPASQTIVDNLVNFFTAEQALSGKKVLVTAAGTIEPIDPVRYIGNRSSGKMGYAIAEEAAKRGAQVVLVSGPSAVAASDNIRLIKIETAEEMMQATLAEFADADIIIKAAAVADYRVKNVASQKIKKTADNFVLELEKNPDILLELGKRKSAEQFLVGFAAETQDLLRYAKGKLERKNLDMIVANDVSAPGAGFNTDTNIAKLLYKNGKIEDLPLMQKTALANHLLNKIMLEYGKA